METSKENIYANNKILIEAANIGRFMQVCNMVAIADGGEPIFGGEKLLKESPRKFFALIAPRVKKILRRNFQKYKAFVLGTMNY